MARARNIKPGFFRNEYLAELPYETRLLFIGLWTLADREGRLEDRPKRIKIELFPCDDIDIEESLNQLQDKGFIIRYENGGNHYITVVNFTKHQNPHRAEKPSEIPAPDGHHANTVQAPCKNDSCRADSLIPDSLKLNPDYLIPEQTCVSDEYTDEFEQFWQVYPKSRRKEKKAAYRAWKARLKAGAKPEQLITAATLYAQECKGKDPRYIKLPKTFLGPDCPWEEYQTKYSWERGLLGSTIGNEGEDDP